MSSLYGNMGAAGNSLRGNNSGSMKEKIPSGYRKGTLNQFTPEQMELFQGLFSNLGPDSYLSKLAGGDQSLFQEMEAPAFRDFERSLGQLGSRFSEFAPGAMSAQKGSGFKLAGTQAASDFAQDLQANRQSLQRQALQDLMNLSSQLLQQRPYENFLVEKQQKQGGLGGLIGAGLGGAAGFFAGGPAGAMTGAQLGHGIGSAF